MTRLARHEYAAAIRARYHSAGKQDRGRILDEFCRTTGSHRKAAIRPLRHPPGSRVGRRRGRRRFGPELGAEPTRLWELSDRPCSKLLAPLLPTLVSALERHGELSLPPRSGPPAPLAPHLGFLSVGLPAPDPRDAGRG